MSLELQFDFRIAYSMLERAILQLIQDRDEVQLWYTTIWGRFPPKIVLGLWYSLSENCGRGWVCGDQNLKDVVVVGVGVVIYGKICIMVFTFQKCFV